MIVNLFTVVEEKLWANFQSRFLFPIYFQEIGQLSMGLHAIACNHMQLHATTVKSGDWTSLCLTSRPQRHRA
jgi:hypothetical protein